MFGNTKQSAGTVTISYDKTSTFGLPRFVVTFSEVSSEHIESIKSKLAEQSIEILETDTHQSFGVIINYKPIRVTSERGCSLTQAFQSICDAVTSVNQNITITSDSTCRTALEYFNTKLESLRLESPKLVYTNLCAFDIAYLHGDERPEEITEGDEKKYPQDIERLERESRGIKERDAAREKEKERKKELGEIESLTIEEEERQKAEDERESQAEIARMLAAGEGEGAGENTPDSELPHDQYGSSEKEARRIAEEILIEIRDRLIALTQRYPHNDASQAIYCKEPERQVEIINEFIQGVFALSTEYQRKLEGSIHTNVCGDEDSLFARVSHILDHSKLIEVVNDFAFFYQLNGNGENLPPFSQMIDQYQNADQPILYGQQKSKGFWASVWQFFFGGYSEPSYQPADKEKMLPIGKDQLLSVINAKHRSTGWLATPTSVRSTAIRELRNLAEDPLNSDETITPEQIEAALRNDKYSTRRLGLFQDPNAKVTTGTSTDQVVIELGRLSRGQRN